MTPTTSLPETARRIIDNLRANGFEPDKTEDQILALMEEAGEVVGAYRRSTGRARRSGTPKDFHHELADLVITAHITAIVLGYELTAQPIRLMFGVEPVDAWPHVMSIYQAVSEFSDVWGTGVDGHEELNTVVRIVYHLTSALHIDLDAAIADKLKIVFSRGWREVTS